MWRNQNQKDTQPIQTCSEDYALHLFATVLHWGVSLYFDLDFVDLEGSCCWRCLFPTSLMIRGHCPVLLDQPIRGLLYYVSTRD